MDTINQAFDTFNAKLSTEFLGRFLDFANSMWLGYYGLFVLPVIIFLLITGFRYMINDIDGNKLRQTLLSFGKYLFFCIFGYFMLPTLEAIEQSMENTVQNLAASAKVSMVTEAQNKATILDERYKEKLNEFCDLYREKMGGSEYSYLWQNNTDPQAVWNCQFLVLQNTEAITPEIASDVKELQAAAGVVYDAQSDATAANKNAAELERMMSPDGNVAQNDDESVSMFSWKELVSAILQFISRLLETLVRTIRIFILIILRFTFPIAIAVSIIPGLTKTAEAWWDSYKTVLLWGVVMIVISIISAYAQNITLGASDGTMAFMGILVQFIGAVAYLLSPNLTVMCFGGSSAVSQLPQQMIQSMSAVAAASNMVMKKVTSNVRGGAKFGQTAKTTVQGYQNASNKHISPQTALKQQQMRQSLQDEQMRDTLRKQMNQ